MSDKTATATSFRPVCADYTEVTAVRADDPGAVARAWAARTRRPTVRGDGRLMIVAADHPARGALAVGDRPTAMNSRTDLLDRLRAALAEAGVDGVLATADVLDDLVLLGALEDKVVFSSTLAEPLAWANTRLVRDDPVEAVAAMKRDGERPLRTIGSATLCRTLLTAGLVDRLRVVVFPVVNGATGRDPFYAGWPDVTLETLEHRTFDGRLQMYEYVPTVLNRPPG